MSTSDTVGIIGAGTMGAGIAQVAITHGWRAVVRDVDADRVAHALESIRGRLDRQVEKGRMTAEQRDEAAGRLESGGCPNCFRGARLVIEAVVENVDIKGAVLRECADTLLTDEPDLILATNTSSLSVTDIGEACGRPDRIVGMHFFNPAPLMRLCEVIAGDATRPEIVSETTTIAKAWGKEVAVARDVAGFIVNHVARPYYLEAFRVLDDGYAGVAEIDAIMRRLGGFRMGPFELADLIGMDVNTTAARTVWEALDRPPLLHPSATQEEIVAAGHLGRKTGRGMYVYPESGDPTPAVEVERRTLVPADDLARAVDDFVAAATDETGTPLQRYVFARILVAIFLQAAAARQRGVATEADIDVAMKFGVNYPLGPFEWTARVGTERVIALAEALNGTVDDGRFDPAPLR